VESQLPCKWKQHGFWAKYGEKSPASFGFWKRSLDPRSSSTEDSHQ